MYDYKNLPHSKNRGFSLVELLVALVFTGLLMAGMSRIFTSSVSNFASALETTGIQRTARFALLDLQEKVLQAGYLLPPRIVTALIGNTAQPPIKIETLALGGTSKISYTPDGSEASRVTLPNPDELQMVMDIPLSIQGSVTNAVDPSITPNTLVVTITYGGTELAAGDLVFIQDSAWEILKIKDTPTHVGNTYTLILETSSGLVDSFGNDAKANLVSPQILHAHFGASAAGNGAQVSFIRPLQVVSYTLQEMKLDPSNDLASTPCLVRRTKALEDAGWGTSVVVVEGVTGFQLDWSLDGGANWIRKKNGLTDSAWGSVKTATNTVLTTSGSPFAKLLKGGMDSAADPFWFNYIPVVIKIDIETRTRIQRTEYSNSANTANFRTRRETLLVSPRNFALGQP